MFRVPGMPEVATQDEWRDWRREVQRQYPLRFFVNYRLRPLLRRMWARYVHDPVYYLKCRLWYRYNVLVCRRLPPTWVDRDHLMLHAAFQCLVDFVERERPDTATDTWQQVYDNYRTVSDDPEISEPFAKMRADAWMEVKELYHWWKACDPWDDNDEKQDEMLRRLIAVRGYLWT